LPSGAEEIGHWNNDEPSRDKRISLTAGGNGYILFGNTRNKGLEEVSAIIQGELGAAKYPR